MNIGKRTRSASLGAFKGELISSACIMLADICLGHQSRGLWYPGCTDKFSRAAAAGKLLQYQVFGHPKPKLSAMSLKAPRLRSFRASP